jgi:hypothetical protein
VHYHSLDFRDVSPIDILLNNSQHLSGSSRATLGSAFVIWRRIIPCS